MAEDVALMIVNQMKYQMARLARSIVLALADNRVTATEGMQLGMEGMMLGSTVAMLLEHADRETRQAVLAVLEQGTFVMPPEETTTLP